MSTSPFSRPGADVSKELTHEAKKYIPGGIQHNLAFNYPFPLAVAKAQGPYLWDVDTNRYIDFLQAGGPTILGSNYEPVQKKDTRTHTRVRSRDRPFSRI